MNERWKVTQGRWGSWLVWRGGTVKSAFGTWRAAYLWARQEAVYENLSIVSLEICP